MEVQMKPRFVGMVIALLAGCSGCKPAEPLGPVPPSGPPLAANQALAGNATIRFVDMEGGCWVIVTAAGKYEPIGLSDSFHKDGLRVYAVVRGAVNGASVCQMAPLVTIDTIRIVD